MIKIDLHTHSTASVDGGIKDEQYAKALEDGIDCIAITDHNNIRMAQRLHNSLGERIIVGQEITTTAGDIIGLFLTKSVASHQSPLATAQAIKAQGGLVYVPHPFETVRAGLSEEALIPIIDLVDIVEIHNGRALFQNHGPKAATWARLNHKAAAASSDAHGYKGMGSTYTSIAEIPDANNLVKQLLKARYTTSRPPLKTLLYPKINRFSKHLHRR